MPFGDYPVFQTPSRGEAIYTRHTSRRLTLPSKVLPCTFTAARAKVRHGSHRIKPKPPRSDLLSFVTLQCLKSKRPGWWGCQVPPELAHSVSTLSASRPEGHLFQPTGFVSPRQHSWAYAFKAFSLPQRRTHSYVLSSHAVWLCTQTKRTTSKGYTLREARTPKRCRPSTRMPSWRFPLWGSPSRRR